MSLSSCVSPATFICVLIATITRSRLISWKLATALKQEPQNEDAGGAVTVPLL